MVAVVLVDARFAHIRPYVGVSEVFLSHAGKQKSVCCSSHSLLSARP